MAAYGRGGVHFAAVRDAVLTGLVSVSACFAHSAFAHACSPEIRLLDGATREVRVFRAGNVATDIPITGLRGWSKCRMSAVKEFVLAGVPSKRLDVWCYTTGGQVVNASTVASGAAAVTIIQLLAAPVTFSGPPEDEAISTPGYRELTLVCGA